MTETFDLVVLGGGPGGYACALRAADLGLEVAIVERDLMGGVCLHRGCVPTRAMLHGVSFVYGAGEPALRWGVETKVTRVDLDKLIAQRDRVVELNHRAVERHLHAAGVQVVRGHGRLAGPRTVDVGTRVLEARAGIVLATGSRPRPLRSHPFDGTRVLSSDDVFGLREIPASAVIVGGGAVGAEFSQIFRTLGATVTLVEREPHLVPFEDEDVGRELERALRRQGIGCHSGVRVTSIDDTEDGVEVELTSGVRLRAEVVIAAIGRDANSGDVGLDLAGVAVEDGHVAIGDWKTLQTNVPGIHAVGDLVPWPSQGRAHVAFAEGMTVAEALAGTETAGIDYEQVPRVTHGLIETACVGLSEAQARERGIDARTDSMPLKAVAKGLMLGEPGSVKVVYEEEGDVLGVHIVGPHASELIGEAVAVTAFEASPREAAGIVHAHPTLSEILGELFMAAAAAPLHHR